MIPLLPPAPAPYQLQLGWFLLPAVSSPSVVRVVRMASWRPLGTCEHQVCSHMGLGSNFRKVMGWGRYYALLQAVLVLSLQGVTKVRESQMSLELWTQPLGEKKKNW